MLLGLTQPLGGGAGWQPPRQFLATRACMLVQECPRPKVLYVARQPLPPPRTKLGGRPQPPLFSRLLLRSVGCGSRLVQTCHSFFLSIFRRLLFWSNNRRVVFNQGHVRPILKVCHLTSSPLCRCPAVISIHHYNEDRSSCHCPGHAPQHV
jgi:hypothetical protein